MAQHAPNNMAPKHTGQQLELQEEIGKTLWITNVTYFS